MQPKKKSLGQRKRSEFDQVGKSNIQQFQNTLPEINTKQVVGQYTPYKSVMVDPALNFVNPTSRHLKFTRSDQKHVFSQAISPRVEENKQDLDESEKAINLETKRLIKAESTQYELDRPKYQLSRKTFKIGYSLSPQMFGATSSKISLNPSMNQTKLSPSHSGVMSHNYFNKVARDQNIQIDAKECEIEAKLEQAQQLNHQKDILTELLEYYQMMMATTIGQMTVHNSLNISDLQQLIKRLNKSIYIANNRVKSVNDKQIDLMKGDVDRALNERSKMLNELTEFKETRTIEAYFSRFHKIPNVEDRKTLIKQMDEFLADERIQLNANYGLRFDTSGVEQLLETFEEANDFGLAETDQISPEGFELKMRALVKEIKTVMLTEAEGVRRLTEKNIKDKLALTGGKVPMKNKGVGTEEWSKIHHRHQRAIEDLTIKLSNVTEESEKTIKQLTYRFDQRGKELIAVSAKVEVLEEFKKKMNISSIHKQLSDQLYNILSEQLPGEKVAEVMIKFQESIKMIDRNQKMNITSVDNKEESIDSQKKAGLFKQKVKKESFVVQDEEDVDSEASPEPKPAQSRDNSQSQPNPKTNAPFIMPEFDKSTFKMIETNTESIKVIFKESENLLDHFHVKKENLINIEKQVIALGETFKLIDKLASKMRYIISACEETQGTQIGPSVQLQSLHLNTTLDKLIQSGDFKNSIKCATQFQSLPNLRQVIDDVKRVKNMQEQYLTHEDESKRDNYFSEVLFSFVQLLFFKEAAIDLPNKNQLNKFAEVCDVVKDIRELLLALLTQDQIAFLSKATQTNRDYKLAFNEILDIKTQLLRCFPKNMQHEVVKNEAVEILSKLDETSSMMGQIHRLPKDLNLIVQKIYQMIKNNKKKGNKQVILKQDVQYVSQKEKNLKEKMTLQTLKEEDEELSFKFDSGNEAEIVLDKSAGKEIKKQVSITAETSKKPAGDKPQPAALKIQKTVGKKVFSNQETKIVPTQQSFSKEEVEQAVQVAVQNAVQNALKAAINKHESEMKAIKDELEQQKSSKEQLQTSLNQSSQQTNKPEQQTPTPKLEEIPEQVKKPKQQSQQSQQAKVKANASAEQTNKGESKPAGKKTTGQKQEHKSVQPTNKSQNKTTTQQQQNKKSTQESSHTNQSMQEKSQSPHRRKDSQRLEVLVEEDEGHSIQNDESKTDLKSPDTPGSQRQRKVEQTQRQTNKKEIQNAQQIQTLQNSLERLQESVIEEEDDQNFSPSESLITSQKIVVVKRQAAKDRNLDGQQTNEFEAYQESNMEVEDTTGRQDNERRNSKFKLGQKNEKSQVDVIQIMDQLESLNESNEQTDGTPKIGYNNTFSKSPQKMNEEQTIFNSAGQSQIGVFQPPESINLNQSIDTQHIVGNGRKESAILTPPSVEHLQRPRLDNQIEQNKLDIKIKPKRDLINEHSFKPAITFKGKKQPLNPSRNEKNTTPDDIYTSTIYDRTSQQSMGGRHDFERVNTTGEEVVMNQTFQNQALTKKDSQTTISDKLEPKLNQKTLTMKKGKKLRLNTDLIPVEDKQISALSNAIDEGQKSPTRVKQIKAKDQETTTTAANVDHLDEFMSLVSSAFDQLINQFSPQELEQKQVLSRVQKFSDALFKIQESLKNSRLSLHEEEIPVQPLNSDRSIKKSPRIIPAANQFERPGVYQLALNQNRKERVTVKTVGRIGGGFMGHSAR